MLGTILPQMGEKRTYSTIISYDQLTAFWSASINIEYSNETRMFVVSVLVQNKCEA